MLHHVDSEIFYFLLELLHAAGVRVESPGVQLHFQKVIVGLSFLIPALGDNISVDIVGGVKRCVVAVYVDALAFTTRALEVGFDVLAACFVK